jgi:hypothetical protein
MRLEALMSNGQTFLVDLIVADVEPLGWVDTLRFVGLRDRPSKSFVSNAIRKGVDGVDTLA